MARSRAVVVSLLVSCSRPDAGPAVERRIDAEPANEAVARTDHARQELRDATAGIAAFWPWWASVAPDARLELAFGKDPVLADVLSQRVSAIHPGSHGSSAPVARPSTR